MLPKKKLDVLFHFFQEREHASVFVITRKRRAIKKSTHTTLLIYRANCARLLLMFEGKKFFILFFFLSIVRRHLRDIFRSLRCCIYIYANITFPRMQYCKNHLLLRQARLQNPPSLSSTSCRASPDFVRAKGRRGAPNASIFFISFCAEQM